MDATRTGRRVRPTRCTRVAEGGARRSLDLRGLPSKEICSQVTTFRKGFVQGDTKAVIARRQTEEVYAADLVSERGCVDGLCTVEPIARDSVLGERRSR